LFVALGGGWWEKSNDTLQAAAGTATPDAGQAASATAAPQMTPGAGPRKTEDMR
jgi:hypothetical protein